MTNGQIRIRGNAGGKSAQPIVEPGGDERQGHYYRRFGGHEIGMRMRREVIAVKGLRHLRLQMKGGTISWQAAPRFARAWMVRGTIISLKPLALMPTFSYACTYSPPSSAFTPRVSSHWAFPFHAAATTPFSATRGTPRFRVKAKSSSGSHKPLDRTAVSALLDGWQLTDRVLLSADFSKPTSAPAASAHPEPSRPLPQPLVRRDWPNGRSAAYTNRRTDSLHPAAAAIASAS